MIIHIIGFNHVEEPLPHELVFCGTFFAFLLISILGAIGIFLNLPMIMVMESIINGFGFVMYLIVSYLAMYNAEQDHHLQYLTDKEEAEHFFFKMSRMQSIASLVGTFQFLLHFVICIDLLTIQKSPVIIEPVPGTSKVDTSPCFPLPETFTMADYRAGNAPLELELPILQWFQNLFCKKNE